MQKNKKNERGSISLFVLLSALFFLTVVVGVGVNFKNKEASVDREFQKIKSSYEVDVGNEEQVYNNLYTPIYVVIYQDGEMTFSSTKEKDQNRAISYDGTNNDISQRKFNSPDEIPWKSYYSQVIKVTIKDRIKPYHTSLWFYNLTNLTDIYNIQFLDTKNTISMRNMFRGCSSIEQLDLSTFDTRNVTDMFHMFHNCYALKSLNLSSFSTELVTNMNSMFAGCINLETLDLSSFDTENVEDMYGMFMGHSSTGDMKLKEINGIEKFKTSNVRNMGAMFQRCAVEELDLTNFNTGKVENMSAMFCYCTSLKRIYVSNNFVTTLVSTSDGMFDHCNLLVGNTGTKYDPTKHNALMAKIDTAIYDAEYNLISGVPGYFSTKL